MGTLTKVYKCLHADHTYTCIYALIIDKHVDLYVKHILARAKVSIYRTCQGNITKGRDGNIAIDYGFSLSLIMDKDHKSKYTISSALLCYLFLRVEYLCYNINKQERETMSFD